MFIYPPLNRVRWCFQSSEEKCSVQNHLKICSNRRTSPISSPKKKISDAHTWLQTKPKSQIPTKCYAPNQKIKLGPGTFHKLEVGLDSMNATIAPNFGAPSAFVRTSANISPVGTCETVTILRLTSSRT